MNYADISIHRLISLHTKGIIAVCNGDKKVFGVEFVGD